MPFAPLRKLALLILLGAIAITGHAADIRLTGRLISVHSQAGCGAFLIGSPVRYQVTSGARDLTGTQITAIVPCIEIPSTKGNVREFVVGDIHDLILTNEKPHGMITFEASDPSWFYVKSATIAPQQGSK